MNPHHKILNFLKYLIIPYLFYSVSHLAIRFPHILKKCYFTPDVNRYVSLLSPEKPFDYVIFQSKPNDSAGFSLFTGKFTYEAAFQLNGAG